tara:strand:+ start:50 stop:472 length:423 start_codon:yes stop_codon:yes gene_type:complete
MSKFIQFNAQTSGAAQPAEPIAPLLINVEDISSFSATGAVAAVKTLVIQLQGRYARAGAGADAQTAPAGNTLTLTFSTSINAAVAPITVDGQPNPFVQAMVAAISQEVPNVAVYQLGNDQSTAAAAPNGVQMYIRTAVLS